MTAPAEPAVAVAPVGHASAAVHGYIPLAGRHDLYRATFAGPAAGALSQESRHESLETRGLLHPRPEAVTAGLFCSADPFFFALDKVQV